jgi:CHAT domain-containing protein
VIAAVVFLSCSAVQTSHQQPSASADVDTSNGEDVDINTFKSENEEGGEQGTVLEDCEEKKIWDAEKRGNVAYCRGDLKGAAAAYEKGVDLARSCNGPGAGDQLQAEVGALFGHALARKGDWGAAERILRQSIAQWTRGESVDVREDPSEDAAGYSEEKRSYLEEGENVSRDLETVLVREGKSEEALEVADSRRAVTLRDIRAARAQGVARGERSTSELRRIASEQTVTFVIYSSTEYWTGGFVNGPMPYGASGGCYAQSPAHSLHIWVIGSSGRMEIRTVDLSNPRLVSMTGKSEGRGGYLSVGARSLREVLVGAGSEESSEALRLLYDVLIAPISDLLPSAPGAEVVFVPDGPLFYAPFAALQAADGTYLIDRYTIRLLPSLRQVTSLSSTRRARSDHALVVADPQPMPDGLLPLPAARQEAESVAALLGATPLIGTQATLQAVVERLPSAEIAHFATHAKFNEEYGNMSYLVLVPPGPAGVRVETKDDALFMSGEEGDAAMGHLTAETISDMRLGAEVVVLSACGTGRGDITGEGVSGLASAFLSAGAHGVVLTLWGVPDESTQRLMIEFYRSMLAGSGTARALREAMLKTRARYPSPHVWAGFELLGAGV